MNIRKILGIGLINTIRMNLHYFGLKGLVKPKMLVSRNTRIRELRGTVKVHGGGLIQLGLGDVGLIDNKYQRTIWQNEHEGIIEFNGKCCLGPGSKIVNRGKLIFGENFVITANSAIICYDEIEFGKDNLFSWGCSVMDTDFHKIIDLDNERILNKNKAVKFGDRIWVCSDCDVLKGVVVADDVVIAKGSTVTKPLLKGNSIYKNNSILKQNIRWEI